MVEAIQADKKYDRKSVYYDGQNILLKGDTNDRETSIKGKDEVIENVEVTTQCGIEFNGVITKYNEDLLRESDYIVEDSEDKYIVESKSRYLSIIVNNASYTDTINDYETKSEDIMNISDEIESNHSLFSYYTGQMVSSNNVKMIGFHLVIEKGGVVYSVTYAGLGNYEDISIEAIAVVKSIVM